LSIPLAEPSVDNLPPAAVRTGEERAFAQNVAVFVQFVFFVVAEVDGRDGHLFFITNLKILNSDVLKKLVIFCVFAV
jgi:hypothetical protein